MRTRRYGHACALVTTLVLASSLVIVIASAAPARVDRQIPGVALRRLHMPGPVRAVVVRIDPAIVSVDTVPARPGAHGYATLRRVSQRRHAIVAINGDLSHEGAPAHLLMHNGLLLTSGDGVGAAFAFDATGTRASVVIDRAPITAVRLDTGAHIGVARWNGGDAPSRRLVAFPSWSAPQTDHRSICSALLRPADDGWRPNRFRVGSSGCGLAQTPEPGEVVAVARRASPSGRWLQGLSPGVPIGVRVAARLPTVSEAFGGVPLLVHRGRVVSNRCGPLTCVLHPRTAAGLTRGCLDDDASTSCRLLVVVVDGRRSGWSIGMTTDQLAHLMRRLGAREAINLDGGASSQLLVRGRTQNRVAPGARRAVVSAIIVRRTPEMGGARGRSRDHRDRRS